VGLLARTHEHLLLTKQARGVHLVADLLQCCDAAFFLDLEPAALDFVLLKVACGFHVLDGDGGVGWQTILRCDCLTRKRFTCRRLKID
jgi:hypothetical protein